MVPKRDAADTSVLGLNSHSAFANYSHFLLYRLNPQRHIDAHGRRDHDLNVDHGRRESGQSNSLSCNSLAR